MLATASAGEEEEELEKFRVGARVRRARMPAWTLQWVLAMPRA